MGLFHVGVSNVSSDFFQVTTWMIATATVGASPQFLNYGQNKPNPLQKLQKAFASGPGSLSSYLPLIQKYVPGASLTLPSTTTPPTSPPTTSYAPIINQQQQLPKLEAPEPFYKAQPSAVLTPPQAYEASNTKYYDVPVPSQDLQVPNQVPWNPSNDPRFYFDNPEIPSQGEIPTSLHPKKYDKYLHTTPKPYAKGGNKKKKSHKAHQNLIKQEQKRLKAEKVHKIRIKSDDQLHPGLKNEPQTAESGYLPGFDTHAGYVGHHDHNGYSQYDHAGYGHAPTGYAADGGTPSHGGSTHAGYSHHPSAPGYTDGGTTHSGYANHHTSGYSDGGATHAGYGHHQPSGFTDGGSDLRAAVNAESHHVQHPPKERLEFQLHGHDGPNSYKWGFDHGEG